MKKLIGTLAVAILACGLFTGCTDAQRSGMAAWGNPHLAELYSGGKLVKVWVTTGRISNESNSDGYYFRDAISGKLVCVNGDIVFTTYDSEQVAIQDAKKLIENIK